MICVLVVASGAAWESAALRLLGERAGVVVLKRCVDVDDLLAVATAGQAQVAVVALDAPGLDAAAVEHLRRHRVRPVAVVAGGIAERDQGRLRAHRIGIAALVADSELDGLGDAVTAADDDEVPGPLEETPIGDPPAPDRARPGRRRLGTAGRAGSDHGGHRARRRAGRARARDRAGRRRPLRRRGRPAARRARRGVRAAVGGQARVLGPARRAAVDGAPGSRPAPLGGDRAAPAGPVDRGPARGRGAPGRGRCARRRTWSWTPASASRRTPAPTSAAARVATR